MLASLATTATKSVCSPPPPPLLPLPNAVPLTFLGPTNQKKIAPMMESFFVAFVLPEFKSPHGYLRYRVRSRPLLPPRVAVLTPGTSQACEVVEKFESCDMDWEHKGVRPLSFPARSRWHWLTWRDRLAEHRVGVLGRHGRHHGRRSPCPDPGRYYAPGVGPIRRQCVRLSLHPFGWTLTRALFFKSEHEWSRALAASCRVSR